MLDLFSGIGGFALAAQWVWGSALEIVSFCEIEPYCCAVLKKHWPGVPVHGDIRTMKGDAYGRIDLLTGGFPCQPFSCAGKQRGSDDNRYLWPEMLRVICEVRPRWVVAENVRGLLSIQQGVAFESVCVSMEAAGYEVQAMVLPACGVGAPHRRDRVWIVGYSREFDGEQSCPKGRRKEVDREILEDARWEEMPNSVEGSGQDVADAAAIDQGWSINNSMRGRCGSTEGRIQTGRDSLIRSDWWNSEPDVGRVAHGVPSRVDRLRALGNAIVPQVAAEIFRVIRRIDNGT